MREPSVEGSIPAVQMLGLPKPAFMPCPDCGASVASVDWDEHVCDRERWLDYQLFLQRSDVERFEGDLAAYFDSPEGRFQLWDAERRRPREPDQTDDDAPEG
jgi:hypothetical protein